MRMPSFQIPRPSDHDKMSDFVTRSAFLNPQNTITSMTRYSESTVRRNPNISDVVQQEFLLRHPQPTAVTSALRTGRKFCDVNVWEISLRRAHLRVVLRIDWLLSSQVIFFYVSTVALQMLARLSVSQLAVTCLLLISLKC